eukprot:3763529-Alexandrium_andersonii.AAC.1
MSDPQKAAMALDKFRKENYVAGKFRKKLIDWAQWKRSFGIRLSFTERCGEELWDFTDFKKHHEERGMDITWIKS